VVVRAAELCWAIGIYSGPCPLSLSPNAAVANPVLTRADVSDARALFVADPFMVHEDGRWYMFFEVMNLDTDRGEIALAVSSDGFEWEYSGIVLREPFHLSYPYVFDWDGEYHMIPETLEANSVSLYRADPFPSRWKPVGAVLKIQCADPSIYFHDGSWWLFACSPARSETLRLYRSACPTGPWREHPRSPIIERDARVARPAGRITSWRDTAIRYAQDCHADYGLRVRAFEILELTPTSYVEREVEQSPVLGAGADGWNSGRMHHVDPHMTADGLWIACVDGC
jgi:hypothetical protein